MNTNQQAQQLINEHGHNAYNVASYNYNQAYDVCKSISYSADNHDTALAAFKNSDYWFSVSMQVFHLQNN